MWTTPAATEMRFGFEVHPFLSPGKANSTFNKLFNLLKTL